MNVPHRRARGRWIGWLHIVLMPLTVLAFAFSLVGISTLVVSVGLLFLGISVPLTRWLADVHRAEAGRLLGAPVPRPYRARAAGSMLGRLVEVGRDPQSWRDLLWLLVSATVGFALSVTSVALLLSVAWWLIQPLLIGVTPNGVFDMDVGIVDIDTVPESFLLWSFAAAAVPLWWWGAPLLMSWRARIDAALLGPTRDARVRLLEQRVQTLAETRSDAVDVQAAELRRIERDLHDGAQARLVASRMTLGMALDAIEKDPDAARALLLEAQATTGDALADLRGVVRGIHPPVLSDRGLVGAVQALALQMPIPVSILATLSGRPPAPVESALYFAVAECLANVGKHAGATRASVTLEHRDGSLHVVVDDDGGGGAELGADGGLAGLGRRLAVFDGTLDVHSPVGGPTRVAMMVPCELSSERT